MKDELGRFVKGHSYSVGNKWNVGRVRPQSERIKISQSLMGEKNHFYGKHHTQETRNLISEKNKRQVSILKGTKGILKPNKTSFKKGMTPWNKGKYKLIEERIKRPYRELNDIIRSTKRWTHWRQTVFKRDGFMCQECGKDKCELHPHHKITVKHCVDTNNIELIYDVNNGVTLCVKCHRLKHNKQQRR